MLGGMDFSHAIFATTEVEEPSSYFSCPRCSTVINESQVTDVLDEKKISCQGCGEKFDILTASMLLRNEFIDLADNPKLALDMVWYHVSEKEPSEMDFESDREMHVGQMGSVNHYVSLHPRFDGKSRYLYTLQFYPDVILYDKIIDDENNWIWTEHLFRGMSTSDLDVDGFVYLNRFEAPGSLSIVARRCAFDMISVVEF